MFLEWNLTLTIALICIAVVVCVFLVFFILFFLKKNKKTKIKIDERFIGKLLEALGSKNNISSVKNINGRVIFEVDDLEKVTFDDLKELSSTGVFITNQSIKMLFTYDSDVICKEVALRIKE